jgi:hypothetical protein
MRKDLLFHSEPADVGILSCDIADSLSAEEGVVSRDKLSGMRVNRWQLPIN